MNLPRQLLRKHGYVCVALLIFASPIFAQENGTRRIRVLHITEPIKIDGRLDEPGWSQAEVATDFRQQEPSEGEPASEKTEVRLLFDDKNLYVGVHAFDSEPARINSRELVRDATFSNDDKVEILLDTYHDRRNAYRFAVNPLGTQQDALITDEGRDLNLSWDAPWISAGRIDQTGWIVEIAIPLTTLRFTEGASTWGLNFARIIRRKNEENLWTSWQRSFGLERVSQAGESDITLPLVPNCASFSEKTGLPLRVNERGGCGNRLKQSRCCAKANSWSINSCASIEDALTIRWHWLTSGEQ